MTTDQIKEVAKFLGYKFQKNETTHPDGWYENENDEAQHGFCLFEKEFVNFESSWEWLHSLIEICWSKTTEHQREFDGHVLFELGLFASKKEVFEAAIQFIISYNKKS